MQAVILAAGVGSRLKKLTGGSSKALVDIGGRPLILHQLEALADHGIGPVMVVVGHEADKVQEVIGDRAETILNERFTETNSLYSLWLARDWITGPFLLLNCDLFFDPSILARLMEDPGNVLAYDSTSSRGQEQTKVAIRKRRVVDLGKDLPAIGARGESLGMLKFEADGARAMVATADHLIRVEGQEQAWVIEATRSVCGQVPLYGLNVAGEAWTEIDFPYDLDVARREVWPAIHRGRWRRHRVVRRSRWAAVAGAAAVMALGGWYASSKIGPASIDWETVPVSGGEAVRLERKGGEQRWWSAGADSVAATVTGPLVAIETRLVHPPGPGTDSLRYVVAITVDGRPHDWRTLTSVDEGDATMGGVRIGDRDRIVLELTPGVHRVAVAMTAGHGERVLVRIRQPETREE